MIAMRMSEMSDCVDGERSGADVRFEGVSTDTRTLRAGELFVALRGPRYDANGLLEAARASGAAGALAERRSDAGLPCVQVQDARLAFARLAGSWRERHSTAIVAVTGSNGKTTVKEMLAAILARAGDVLATRGNLNNDIGVPLTLCRLGQRHRFAVIEMGANHAGEIDALVRLVRPAVAVVTLCAPAHLEGFGSVEAVARAKGEIFAGLQPDGIAVINADDPNAPLWEVLAGGRRKVRFGFGVGAEVRAADLGGSQTRRIRIDTPAGTIETELALLGRHNVVNAAAAVACALALGVGLDACRTGLAEMRPVAGRLQTRHGVRGCRIVDDSYNANPGSLAAAIAAVADLPGRRWLALGDMRELGPEAARFHRDAGRLAREGGIERLFAVGDLAREAAASFGTAATLYTRPEDAAADIGRQIDADVTLLVKGSRSMHMERVVDALAQEA
ncbi:MAG: UDP-N-acetylmuramoyl-tripeptide--D-alanyl-D-alanine ligase [Gammaproteobacteria bacterium]